MANNYSAKVVMELVVGGLTLSLSHAGPSGLVVRDECRPMPASDALLRIFVDDSESVQRIFLPHGIPGAGLPFEFF
jgi:hypothetical protein